MRKWPKPKDPKMLFTRTLMLLGPPPRRQWERIRDENGKVLNMYPRNPKARRWLKEVEKAMAWEIKLQYPELRLGLPLAQHWKNLFMRWLCDEEDTTATNSTTGGVCPYTRVRMGVQRPFHDGRRDRGVQRPSCESGTVESKT